MQHRGARSKRKIGQARAHPAVERGWYYHAVGHALDPIEMTVAQLTKLIEAVGIPAATAAAMGFLLWRLLQYILKDLRSDMEQHDEQLQASLKKVTTILIQQVDRIRVLERNIYRYQDATSVKLGLAAPTYDITRKEQHDEAHQVLRDVGKINGDD
jgi:hypothetical protein